MSETEKTDSQRLEEIRILIKSSERELNVSQGIGGLFELAEQARVLSHAWERIKIILEVKSE